MVVLVPPELLQSPPSREDGVDAATEETLRTYGGELIQRAGPLLRLPLMVVASAAAIFQRFYFRRSFAEFEVRDVAAAAVALASKLEERARNLKHVLLVFYRLQMRELQEEGGKPTYAGQPTPSLDVNGKEFEDMKRDVVRAERYILRELGFEVTLFLDLPHHYVLRYASALTRQGPSALAQRAWSYVNDASRTTLCCTHQPDVIAAAGIFLAARSLDIKLPTSPSWCTVLEVDAKEVRRIAEVIVSLYGKPRVQHVAIPRKKKEKAALQAKPSFAETPGLAGGSPGSEGAEEDGFGAKDGGAKEGGSGDDSPPLVANNGASAPTRQNSDLDGSRVAELVAESVAGSDAAVPSLARQPSARTGVDRQGDSARAEEERRRGKANKDKEKEKENEREKGREKDRDKEKDRERDRDKVRDRHRDKEREKECEADRGRKRDRDLDRKKDKEKARDKAKDKQRKRQSPSSRSSASPSRSPSRQKGRRKQPAKGREKKSKRDASAPSSSSPGSRKRAKRRNPAKHGVDEEDL